MKPSFSLAIILFLSLLQTRGVTVEELRSTPNLTPNNFSSRFANFRFFFRTDVQSPADFLASESGDCDDFSTLAATELAARGYTTRLISVRMKGQVHVVCYVEEANGYLDYNMRARGGLVTCGAELSQIAKSVAKSFKDASWKSVSEFTYERSAKRLVKTVLASERLTASNSR